VKGLWVNERQRVKDKDWGSVDGKVHQSKLARSHNEFTYDSLAGQPNTFSTIPCGNRCV
jgi:hypothetical protein